MTSITDTFPIGGSSPTITNQVSFSNATTRSFSGSTGAQENPVRVYPFCQLNCIGTNDFTVEVEFSVTSLSGAQFLFWLGSDGNYYGAIYALLSGSTLYFGLYSTGSSPTNSINLGTISTGTTYTLKATRTSGQLKITLNGTQVYSGSNPDSLGPSGGQLWYGQVYGSSYANDFLHGTIESFYIAYSF